MYSDKVMDHYENPRNVGKLDKNAPDVGTGLTGAPACGDVMQLQIRVSTDGIIEDAKFKTYGCGSAIASSGFMFLLPTANTKRRLPLQELKAVHIHKVQSFISLTKMRWSTCWMSNITVFLSGLTLYHCKQTKY